MTYEQLKRNAFYEAMKDWVERKINWNNLPPTSILLNKDEYIPEEVLKSNEIEINGLKIPVIYETLGVI